MSKWDKWDESRAKVRPNKRGSRPRTKETPEYSDAVQGRVITVDRGRYTVALPGQEVVSAVRAKALRRSPIAPGDIVSLVGDTSGNEGTLARLVRIEPRSTFLRRSADDTDDSERVLVANTTQLLIVVAAADPTPRTGFIDRALVAAYDARIRPVLLITKVDLVSQDPNGRNDPAGLISHYAELELDIVLSQRGDQDALDHEAIEHLRSLLTGEVTALIGHSGVGKSTMVNALTGADRATGGVNAVTGRGRHTSSSALALNLASTDGLDEASNNKRKVLEDSWIIDTPGIRSFGLAHVDPNDVLAAFEDLVPGSADCEPGCNHESVEAGCGLDAWVESGKAGSHGHARLASLRGLLASLHGASEGSDEKKLGSVEA